MLTLTGCRAEFECVVADDDRACERLFWEAVELQTDRLDGPFSPLSALSGQLYWQLWAGLASTGCDPRRGGL